jgi:thiol-disulfide isomerase/thioredoxin
MRSVTRSSGVSKVEAAVAHHLAVRPPGDQRDVVPGLMQPGADGAADPARTEHHHAHGFTLGPECPAEGWGSPCMTFGAWVLVAAVAAAAGIGAWWTLTNGVFRGTRRVAGVDPGHVSEPPAPVSVLAGTTYDEARGERATLLQFSSAFCAPCRATRRVLADVAEVVPGVSHVELDAEHHLDLVRALGVVRTPTTLVLDAHGREVTRATGAPKPAHVLEALGHGVG